MSSRALARLGRLLFATLVVVEAAGATAAVAAVAPDVARPDLHAIADDSARRHHAAVVADAADQDTVIAAPTRGDDAHQAAGRLVVAIAGAGLILAALF